MTKPLKPGQHVLVSLRRMIAAGEVKDGERIAEIATAQALGVSRMPVRTALRALEREGLVVRLGERGYAARVPSPVEVEGALEVRGVLEGLAARKLAERGLTAREAASFANCIARGDAIFQKGHLDDEDLENFYDYNLAFHDLLIRAAGNPAIAAALLQNNSLPLGSASALAFDWGDRRAEYRHLLAAHDHHGEVMAAIQARDGTRAERIMRQHVYMATESTQRADADQSMPS